MRGHLFIVKLNPVDMDKKKVKEKKNTHTTVTDDEINCEAV